MKAEPDAPAPPDGRGPTSEPLPTAPDESVRAQADRAAKYVEQVLDDLDRMFADTVEERLATVARRACSWFGASGWSVCFLDRGRPVSVRQERPGGEPAGPGEVALALATALPSARQAFEGSSFVVHGDGLAGPAAASGTPVGTVIGAGGYDVDALQWLVCLFADDRAGDLWVGRAALLAAVQAALGFPRAPRGGR
ncbi:hypothetical protein [Nocardioides ferulae]|uniref:hypothetical protein n=1 Tax=Nocardioides ferulae TaxID=2340821 RepID=UPI000F87FAF3|nr:hypothetical protein [Nocardioides ferulae]